MAGGVKNELWVSSLHSWKDVHDIACDSEWEKIMILWL